MGFGIIKGIYRLCESFVVPLLLIGLKRVSSNSVALRGATTCLGFFLLGDFKLDLGVDGFVIGDEFIR